jgi:serine/threonine protein kinase
VHRDIKPCNILLDSEFNVKITDFGTAKLLECTDEKVVRALHNRNRREDSRSLSPRKKNSFVGTNEYISPEVLKGDTPTCAIDLWSLGVMLYRMYSGFTPFLGDNEMETYENICKGKFEKHHSIPEDAWSLIKAILKVEPYERIGCSKSWNNIDYKNIKNHPFFKDVNFNQLKFNQEKYFQKSENELNNGESKCDSKGRPTVASFAVPCPMDEDDQDDEDDFEEDCFTPKSKLKHRFTSDVNYKTPESQVRSQNDLTSFLKNDYFLELTQKHSRKCDTQNYNVPILFDEDSDVVFDSTVGSSSPRIKNT